MPDAAEQAAAHAVFRRSPAMIRLFGAIFARDLAASFHAVRLIGAPPLVEGPLVLVANHPSWWDAELFLWMAATMFSERRCFAPIEAAMLKRYGFFGRVGAFPVEAGSYSAAAAFLALAERVLASADGLLLVNAEGCFRDVRDRPLQVAPGLAHLARRAPTSHFVPLAIEYAFWNERRPNLLLRFGDPIPAGAIATGGTLTGSETLRVALTATMDMLATEAASRDSARFTTLLAGRTKINPFYDTWRRAKALLQGRHFDPAHEHGHGASPP